MAPSISLALVLHNHQPVGNFGWVIARNHGLAYEPLITALERHPGVRVGLHYSGPLLEWLVAEEPAFVARVAALAARDQVELLGGGLYEPVLAALPVADRLAQLRRMRAAVAATFGQVPAGAWLAERVWEPDVPAALAGAGYSWTVLDDAHLRGAAVPEDELWGSYSTDDQGHRIDLLATGKGLRDRIPFGPVEAVIAYLRDHATPDGARVATMGDDGEKLGAWPTTWEHCWGAGRWVDRFFEALEAESSWLHTTTPSAWLAGHPPLRRIYVPGGSYLEMGEWALPPDEAERFRAVLDTDLAAGRAEPRWMRGTIWRGFQGRYREANDLHKQMLRASNKVAAMRAGAARDAAADHLQRGQGNDPYWHGLFGGLYLSHLRTAALGHLVAAEDAADGAARATGTPVDGARTIDLDLDGRLEVIVTAPGQVVTIKPDEGAGIGAWDVRAARYPLTAVLRRRPEAYHRRLREVETLPAETESAGAVSPHARVVTRQQGLEEALVYDAYERRSALVRLLPPRTRAAAVAARGSVVRDDLVAGPFEITDLRPGRVELQRHGWFDGPGGRVPVAVRKTVVVDRRRRRPGLAVAVTVTAGAAPVAATLCLEWALNLSGGGANPAAYYEPLPGRRVRFDGAGAVARSTAAGGPTRLAFGNHDLGLRVTARAEPAAAVGWASIDTVSLSEAGAERTHQGSCLVFAWPLRLAPGASSTVRVDLAAAITHDQGRIGRAAVASHRTDARMAGTRDRSARTGLVQEPPTASRERRPDAGARAGPLGGV